MTNSRNRSKPALKPRWPRLQLLRRKREQRDWITYPDKEGNLHVQPVR